MDFITSQETSKPKLSLNDIKEAKQFLDNEREKINNISSQLILDLKCEVEEVQFFYNKKKGNKTK
jgi:hypothetical protein